VPPLGIEANRDIHDIMIPAKTVRGIVEGDAVPDIFIPRLIDLHAKGRFPFDRLVKFYDLDRNKKAADDAEEGNTLKPVLRLGCPADARDVDQRS
jgi:aryl-alcohol dehydrogenase